MDVVGCVNRARCVHCVHQTLYVQLKKLYTLEGRSPSAFVNPQEAKYIERWPNTTSAWAGWSKFDIPVDRYGRVHSLLICTSSLLGFPTWHQASIGKYLLNKISKSRQGQHSGYSVVHPLVGEGLST